MNRDAAKRALLYVSDTGTDDVEVYVYQPNPAKGTKLVGTLTGFSYPNGECVDGGGDVFVTDKTAARTLEYAHGGTDPIATLSDADEYPVACAVDPVTGNLAVSNGYGTAYGSAGSVSVYADAKGTPKVYTLPDKATGFFCGYDGKSNLFVDGLTEGYSSDVFHLFELAHGRHAFDEIVLNQSIITPGDVQWDGKNLALEDQGLGVIYRFEIRGSKGTETGATQLGTSSQNWVVVEYSIQGTIVVGAGTQNDQPEAAYWRYPAGGNAINEVSSSLVHPFGLAVSDGR
jgi:hypothetical protein